MRALNLGRHSPISLLHCCVQAAQLWSGSQRTNIHKEPKGHFISDLQGMHRLHLKDILINSPLHHFISGKLTSSFQFFFAWLFWFQIATSGKLLSWKTHGKFGFRHLAIDLLTNRVIAGTRSLRHRSKKLLGIHLCHTKACEKSKLSWWFSFSNMGYHSRSLEGDGCRSQWIIDAYLLCLWRFRSSIIEMKTTCRLVSCFHS